MPKLKRSESDERATDFVESLDRGLRLLQCFGTTAGPMTLSDLARAAELPRATARRMLFTLQRGGFVSGDGKLFSLTPHVLTLAASFLRSSQLVTVLQPVLDRVADIGVLSLYTVGAATLLLPQPEPRWPTTMAGRSAENSLPRPASAA